MQPRACNSEFFFTVIPALIKTMDELLCLTFVLQKNSALGVETDASDMENYK